MVADSNEQLEALEAQLTIVSEYNSQTKRMRAEMVALAEMLENMNAKNESLEDMLGESDKRNASLQLELERSKELLQQRSVGVAAATPPEGLHACKLHLFVPNA